MTDLSEAAPCEEEVGVPELEELLHVEDAEDLGEAVLPRGQRVADEGGLCVWTCVVL